jgi:hypothetical protein
MANNRSSRRHHRYSKNTQGWNAQGIFEQGDGAGAADPVAIAAGSLQDLIYTGVPGTIGIFDEAGLVTAVAPAAGEAIYFAQKNTDESIKKTTTIVGGQFTASETFADAPAKQKDLVFPLNINIVGGLQEFVLSARETTPANQPFPIQEGRAIVRSGSPTDIDIATKIAADINNTYDFERNGDNGFVAVNAVSNVVGLVATVGSTFTYTSGSTQVFVPGADVTGDANALVGSYIVNNEVVTDNVFMLQKITAVTFDAVTGNSTIEIYPAYSGALGAGGGPGTETTALADIFYATKAEVDAADVGMTLLGVDDEVHFDTNVSEDLGDAVVTTIDDWNFGSGESWQVAPIEDECTTFDGDTTKNAAWHQDYGTPDLWVNDASTDTYSLFIIESLNRIIPSAGAPQNQTLMQANIIIATISGSALEGILDTVLAPITANN